MLHKIITHSSPGISDQELFLPLSGGLAHVKATFKTAALLSVKDFDNSKVKNEALIFRDDPVPPTKAVAALKGLLSRLRFRSSSKPLGHGEFSSCTAEQHQILTLRYVGIQPLQKSTEYSFTIESTLSHRRQ
ncbi:MAG: hypothetical protein H6619_01580 [Deltaproteobacteria bacterium]|nr:hypothetical protein [Deltaproteobacteria bacterium]